MTLPTLSPKQLLSVREADAKVNIWHGAIRSGKTIGSLIRWLIFVSTASTSGALVIVGRTRDSAWRNVVTPLQDPAITGPAAALIVGNYGAPTVSILGRRVFVMGANDVKAELTLRGLTVAGAYVDEITTLPEGFFTQLLGRMSLPGSKLFGTTNPDNPAHWLKRKFLDRLDVLAHWRVWHFVMDDNPSLTAEYVAQKKAEFTGLWYRRFILGEWVAGEGAVYDVWDPDAHVVEWPYLPPMSRYLAAGVDYGTTNATAAVLLGVTAERRPRLALVDEWRYDPPTEAARWTDGQLSEGLRAWLRGMHQPPKHGPGPRVEWVMVDPAAASFKVQLRADGLPNVTDADNDVTYGIRTVGTLLADRDLIVADRCKHLIREIPGYSWDPKATEKGEDKPIKVADHSLDAARYAVASTETVWRPMLARRAA